MISSTRSNQRDIRIWNRLQHATWAKPNRITSAVLWLIAGGLCALAMPFVGDALWALGVRL